jgi:hypothetical protein
MTEPQTLRCILLNASTVALPTRTSVFSFFDTVMTVCSLPFSPPAAKLKCRRDPGRFKAVVDPGQIMMLGPQISLIQNEKTVQFDASIKFIELTYAKRI